LPIGADQRNERQLVSDATILRLSTALQASLYIKDVIHAFANEIRRIVIVASVTYRNAERQETIEDGSVGQHRCNYEISLLGDSLGEITFTRNKIFPNASKNYSRRCFARLSILHATHYCMGER